MTKTGGGTLAGRGGVVVGRLGRGWGCSHERPGSHPNGRCCGWAAWKREGMQTETEASYPVS